MGNILVKALQRNRINATWFNVGSMHVVTLHRNRTNVCVYLQMTLRNQESGSEYVFTVNNWVKSRDDLDTWVELVPNIDDPDDQLDRE